MTSSIVCSVTVLRTVLYLLLAGSFTATFSSLASPLPRPVTLSAPGHTLEPLSRSGNLRHSLNDSLVVRFPQILTASDLGKRNLLVAQKRYEDAYRRVVSCYQDAVTSSTELHKLSRQSSGIEKAFPTRVANYKASLRCMQSGIGDLGRDKGLAYHDPNNELEELLKAVVVMHKNILADIDHVISSIPVLGPILEPIVYEIKCVLDDLLDVVENLSDILLNSLSPLLTDCLQVTVSLVCKLGLGILNICP